MRQLRLRLRHKEKSVCVDAESRPQREREEREIFICLKRSEWAFIAETEHGHRRTINNCLSSEGETGID